MVLYVVKQMFEELALIVNQQVLESLCLLLVEHSLHDLIKVSTKNGQDFFVRAQEAAEFIQN